MRCYETGERERKKIRKWETGSKDQRVEAIVWKDWTKGKKKVNLN